MQAETGEKEQERFSKFLWKLEQNQEISAEERDSYIGIYRLIAQVEKTDGAAIGALLNQGADITMRNLLTAMRSAKKNMDYRVDDDFAGTKNTTKGPRIDDQIMSSFQTNCMKEVADLLNETKKNGKRVIAVGTTSTRTLETIATKYNEFKECSGWTNIFIYPGYKFKAIDSLSTNFHLPKSTLVMLVSALAGRENILNAYNEAVKEQYRFFSFGDAMFIK